MGYLIIVWADRLRSPQASKADKAVYRVNAWLVAVVVAVLPIAGYWFVYRPRLCLLADAGCTLGSDLGDSCLPYPVGSKITAD